MLTSVPIPDQGFVPTPHVLQAHLELLELVRAKATLSLHGTTVPLILELAPDLVTRQLDKVWIQLGTVVTLVP